MDEPEPTALTGEDLTIAVRLRLALKDQQWHALSVIADRLAGKSPGAVVAVIARMVANRQLEQDDTTAPVRCRLAPRSR